MSGSGGTTYDPTPPQRPCDRLNFRTVLNSPDPAVVSALKVGDKLQVELDLTGGRRKVVAKYNGRVAGSITSDSLPQLISCLEGGHHFYADVQGVAGGRVDVDLQAGA